MAKKTLAHLAADLPKPPGSQFAQPPEHRQAPHPVVRDHPTEPSAQSVQHGRYLTGVHPDDFHHIMNLTALKLKQHLDAGHEWGNGDDEGTIKKTPH